MREFRKGHFEKLETIGEKKKEELSEKEEKILNRLESIFDRYKKELESFAKTVQLLPHIPGLEIEPYSLEKVINGFIRRYEEKTIERYREDKKLDYYPRAVGLFISQIINETVKGYVEEQLRKGTKFKEIQPLITKIDAKIRRPNEVETKGSDRVKNIVANRAKIDNLDFRNPEKPHLSIVGPCGNYVGREMEGGEVHVYGAVRKNIGKKMRGGKLFLYSRVIDEKFDPSAFSERNKGEIWRMKDKELEQVWPKEEKEKKETT